jgi:hypothetical protein
VLRKLEAQQIGVDADLLPYQATGGEGLAAIRVCSLARLREMRQAADRPVDRLDLEALDPANGQD